MDIGEEDEMKLQKRKKSISQWESYIEQVDKSKTNLKAVEGQHGGRSFSQFNPESPSRKSFSHANTISGLFHKKVHT